MSSGPSLVTFADLAAWQAPEEERKVHTALIAVIKKYFPPDWESWKVTHFPFEHLFGQAVMSDIENRLRWAIPTVDLMRCFCEGALSCSERRFKLIKRILIKWPIGRALIYAPHSIMEKMHSDEYYTKFTDTVRALKIEAKLLSRHDASAALGSGQVSQSPQSVSSRKRRIEEVEEETPSHRSKQNRDDQILKLLKVQNEMFSQLIKVSSEQANSISELKQNMASQAEEEVESLDTSSKSITNDQDLYMEEDQKGEPIGEWEAPQFTYHNTENPEADVCSEPYNFEPLTIESEPKITAAPPLLAQQGEKCQRLNTSGWNNIKYADTQRKFQATPVFSNLKVNSLLANHTPQWQQMKSLEKIDLTLAAITHGLLQERHEFQEIYNKTADMGQKAFIGTHFLAQDSKFRKTSDSLLQYVCGRRAETIQQRRAIYKTKNRHLQELLHSIPPSATHLFEEKAVSTLIKEHDGPDKFFRGNHNFPRSTNIRNSRQPGNRPFHMQRFRTRNTNQPRPQQNPNKPQGRFRGHQKRQQQRGQYKGQHKM